MRRSPPTTTWTANRSPCSVRGSAPTRRRSRTCWPISAPRPAPTCAMSGSDSFEQQIVVDAEAGSAPNIAVFPQPGLASDMASRGFLSPMPTDRRVDPENYAAGESWVDLGTFADDGGNDNLYGFFYKVDVKSLVWYVPGKLRRCRLRSARDHGRAEGADRPDGRRWRDAVVHRSGFRRRDRLAGYRLGGRHASAHPDAGGLRPVGEQRNSVRPMPHRRCHRRIRLFRPQRRLCCRWRRRRGLHRFPRQPQGPLRLSPPQCYMHRQASFIPAFFPEAPKWGRRRFLLLPGL
jgi:alpha-glucoside transport system substrate-binding protein